MSLVLHPQKTFTVVRQIANHLDTDTNYVRAVIRNAYTDAIIDTLNLTDRGSQRFSLNWRIPADPSGEGFYVSIVTSVYTDSGYTTKNANYGDEENTYLVEDRVNAFRGGGGGGVDSRTVRRIMQEEIAKIEIPEVEMPEIEKMPEMKWDTVLSSIAELKTALKPEKPEKIDFKPLFDALQSLRNDVQEKEVTEPTDLSPILEKLNEKDDTDNLTRQEIVELLNALGHKLSNELPKEFISILKSTTFKIAETNAVMDVPKQMKEEPVPFDLSKLSL